MLVKVAPRSDQLMTLEMPYEFSLQMEEFSKKLYFFHIFFGRAAPTGCKVTRGNSSPNFPSHTFASSARAALTISLTGSIQSFTILSQFSDSLIFECILWRRKLQCRAKKVETLFQPPPLVSKWEIFIALYLCFSHHPIFHTLAIIRWLLD